MKVQGQVKGSKSAGVREHTCNNLKEMNEFIATTWAGEIKLAVVVSTADYSNALLATSLACLLQAPLFVTENAEDLSGLTDFGSYPLVTLGEDLADFKAGDAKVVSIPDIAKALAYLKDEGIAVNYIALTNPLDRKTKLKLSLTAPIYACAPWWFGATSERCGAGKGQSLGCSSLEQGQGAA